MKLKLNEVLGLECSGSRDQAQTFVAPPADMFLVPVKNTFTQILDSLELIVRKTMKHKIFRSMSVELQKVFLPTPAFGNEFVLVGAVALSWRHAPFAEILDFG